MKSIRYRPDFFQTQKGSRSHGYLHVVVIAVLGHAATFTRSLVAAVVRTLVAVVALLRRELADTVLALVVRARVVVVAHLSLVGADAVVALAHLARVFVFALNISLAAPRDYIDLADPCGGIAVVLCAPTVTANDAHCNDEKETKDIRRG